jgi:hypothetical protein
MHFEDVGLYERLRAEPQEIAPERSDQAIVLVDLTGKSKPEQLDRFRRGGDKVDVDPGHRYRLIAPIGWRVEPADLIPVLQDVLELLGRLRRDAGVEHFHLAFAGPDVVAFFLGQQFNALGRISLYEFYTGPERYDFVFDLQEDPAAFA